MHKLARYDLEYCTKFTSFCYIDTRNFTCYLISERPYCSFVLDQIHITFSQAKITNSFYTYPSALGSLNVCLKFVSTQATIHLQLLPDEGYLGGVPAMKVPRSSVDT